jgi:DNA-binding GntR family transcriptional regulator
MHKGLRTSMQQTPRVSSVNVGVYERIKEMICQGDLQPGVRLVQQTLAKKMGTSSMPVIEAFRRLERDGLVEHIPHLGSFVRQTTIDDIRELYAVRRAVEGEACLLFVERATEKEYDELVELDKLVNTAARADDIKSSLDADMSFHLHLVSATKVSRLREILDKWQVEQRVFMASPELASGDTHNLVGIHAGIVEAICRHDGVAAAAAMRQHLLSAERSYLAMAEKRP